MSFRVRPDGTIECDTLEEALQLSARVRASNMSPNERLLKEAFEGTGSQRSFPGLEGATNDAINANRVKYERFIKVLNVNQRLAIKTIQAFKHVTLARLTAELNQSNNQATGGVMAGITRLAARFDVGLDELFRRTTEADPEDPRNVGVVYIAGPWLSRLSIPLTEDTPM